MARKYTKMEILAEEVFRRKDAGETNRQIAESYGLTQTQIEQLVNRQNRKRKKLEAGIIVRPKGRPPKTAQTPEAAQEQEIRQLRMTVELLRSSALFSASASLRLVLRLDSAPDLLRSLYMFLLLLVSAL